MTGPGYLLVASYGAVLLWFCMRGIRAGWSSNTQRAMVYALIPAGVAAIFAAGLAFTGTDAQPAATGGAAGVEADATRHQLREFSAALIAADKKGDGALARAVLLPAVALRVTIEHQPGAQQAGSAWYNCALAAKHLTAGAELVANGRRWLNEDQFQQAAGACRT